LLEAHSSKPFNPDIARVFYRAGYIESWGRGIQKICDACKNLGADEPEYIVHGEDIMVKFNALQSAKVSESKTPKRQHDVLNGVLEEQILEELCSNPEITQKDLAKKLSVPYRSLQREMDELKSEEKIERVGGKRYGHWKVKR
jgi:ATP-dependent DNA helicase RecG